MNINNQLTISLIKMNKKLFYKPPKVKPSNRPKKPLPEWNSFQTDLDRYKLSSTEILKKKINAVSKNKEIAKKDWLETLSQLQTGKYVIDEGNNQKPKKKIDLVPRHRFQKDEKVVVPKTRTKSASGKHVYMKNKEEFDEEQEDEEELKMIYNDNNEVEVAATKVEKNNSLINDIKGGHKMNQKQNPLLFEEFEETLKKMENEIKGNNKILDKQLNNQQKDFQYNNKLSNQSERKVKGKATSNRKPEIIEHKDMPQVNAHRSDNEEEEEEKSGDDEDNEEQTDIFEIEKDINKKFDNLNDLEDCMKRLDCMLDNSKQKSMKMQYDLDFKEEPDYRSEEEEVSNKQRSKPKTPKNNIPTNVLPKKSGPKGKKAIKQKNEYQDDNFGYRSEIQESKDNNNNVNYSNDLRDSELYLTNKRLQEQLIMKEKQIRQNLQTSPNKNGEDDDDYLEDHNQDNINQARLLSIKNDLLNSNKMAKPDMRQIQNYDQQRGLLQNNQEFDNIQSEEPHNYEDFNNNNNYYSHIPIPKKIQSTPYDNRDDRVYYDNNIPIQSNSYVQQPPPKRPNNNYDTNKNIPPYNEQQINNNQPNYYQNAIKQPNLPLYSHTNYIEEESYNNFSKPSKQSYPQPLPNRGYSEEIFEDEQPHQFKPNKLKEISSSYNVGPQGKSIKIERNIMDIAKHKAKVCTNEINMFDPSGNPTSYMNQNSNTKELMSPNDPMNYLKSLLEKTKDEIDSLTQGFDNVQPPITSYPMTQLSSNNYNEKPPKQDYYNYSNKYSN